MIKKYRIEILLFVCIILIIGIYPFIYFFGRNFTDLNNVETINDDLKENESSVENIVNNTENIILESSNDEIKTYYVEIKGSVVNPGVYSVSLDNIIKDVVDMAGGFTSEAYIKNINLSKRVKDQMVIYVYSESEYENNNTNLTVDISSYENECICPSYEVTECTDKKESIITVIETDSEETSSEETENTLININEATKEELMSLSGIGETKAEAIIAYRIENGNFEKCEDIVNVSGISNNTYEKIKAYITV